MLTTLVTTVCMPYFFWYSGSPISAFGRILRGLHGKCLRITTPSFRLGDISGDIDVSRKNAEVGVAAKNILNFALRKPFNFLIEAVEIERVDLAGDRGAPIAKSAGK